MLSVIWARSITSIFQTRDWKAKSSLSFLRVELFWGVFFVWVFVWFDLKEVGTNIFPVVRSCDTSLARVLRVWGTGFRRAQWLHAAGKPGDTERGRGLSSPAQGFEVYQLINKVIGNGLSEGGAYVSPQAKRTRSPLFYLLFPVSLLTFFLSFFFPFSFFKA